MLRYAAATATVRERQMDDTPRLLEIYVTPDCFGSDTAYRLAERIRATTGHSVRVVDLSSPGALRPPAVFATPTYLVDGEVVSLGNPDESWLLARLARPRRPVDRASSRTG